MGGNANGEVESGLYDAGLINLRIYSAYNVIHEQAFSVYGDKQLGKKAVAELGEPERRGYMQPIDAVFLRKRVFGRGVFA